MRLACPSDTGFRQHPQVFVRQLMRRRLLLEAIVVPERQPVVVAKDHHFTLRRVGLLDVMAPSFFWISIQTGIG
jgi:hypothetical protein